MTNYSRRKEPNITDLWSSKTAGIKQTKASETEDPDMEAFKDTNEMKDGSYQVSWLWQEYPNLPEN